MEDYNVECTKRSDMSLESPWSYHGPSERGWDGLREEGVFAAGGNCLWHAELAKDKST